MKVRQLLISFATLMMLLGFSVMPAYAYYYPSYYGYSQYYNGGFLANHPYVKKAAIGGGLGAILGGVIAPTGDRVGGAMKGAALGGAAGMGFEYLRERGAFSRFSNW